MIKLRLNEKVYYKNKRKFVEAYKSVGLRWVENTPFGDVWISEDKTSYLRKIPEKDDYKRFYAHNVPVMVKFLTDLGAEDISNEEFEDAVVKAPEPFHNVEFSGHKGFRELLDEVGDRLKVNWGDELSQSLMSDNFKKRWRELQVKYKNYTVQEFYKEIEAKNKRRRKEQGIAEDEKENEEAVIEKKSDDDVLPVKTSKKKTKAVRVKPVKAVINPARLEVKEFKKKVFKITKK